jgi:hypothetical protein
MSDFTPKTRTRCNWIGILEQTRETSNEPVLSTIIKKIPKKIVQIQDSKSFIQFHRTGRKFPGQLGKSLDGFHDSLWINRPLSVLSPSLFSRHSLYYALLNPHQSSCPRNPSTEQLQIPAPGSFDFGRISMPSCKVISRGIILFTIWRPQDQWYNRPRSPFVPALGSDVDGELYGIT